RHPVGRKDINNFSGQKIPAPSKQQWLDLVTAKGGEKGSVDGGLSELALSVGPFAFQAGLSGYAAANMSPDAFEALMFGNAGKTGSVRTLNFQGSSLRAGLFTTLAGSYGLGFGDTKGGSRHMAAGVTLKYVV